MSLKVGIVGAAGYAGAELIRLVLGHPEFELVAITSNADAGGVPELHQRKRSRLHDA